MFLLIICCGDSAGDPPSPFSGGPPGAVRCGVAPGVMGPGPGVAMATCRCRRSEYNQSIKCIVHTENRITQSKNKRKYKPCPGLVVMWGLTGVASASCKRKPSIHLPQLILNMLASNINHYSVHLFETLFKL